MKVVFLGPPGVGKGTQASRFSKNHQIPHIATGDLLRTAITNKTEVGLKASSFIEAGHLVPDNVIIQLMNERLDSPDAEEGYVLDGFPRTIAQGKALDKLLEEKGSGLDRVIYFSLDELTLKERIVGRRSCPSCHSVYHTTFKKPDLEGVCSCGAALVQRKDDSAETVTKRLAVYRDETAPLIDYYKNQGVLLTEIKADGSLDDVAELLEGVIQDNS